MLKELEEQITDLDTTHGHATSIIIQTGLEEARLSKSEEAQQISDSRQGEIYRTAKIL